MSANERDQLREIVRLEAKVGLLQTHIDKLKAAHVSEIEELKADHSALIDKKNGVIVEQAKEIERLEKEKELIR
ncbi:MAG: hypothetical protein ACYTFK_12610 [Planctomycetota bacterium]|jgi:hypothetical protein